MNGFLLAKLFLVCQIVSSDARSLRALDAGQKIHENRRRFANVTDSIEVMVGKHGQRPAGFPLVITEADQCTPAIAEQPLPVNLFDRQARRIKSQSSRSLRGRMRQLPLREPVLSHGVGGAKFAAGVQMKLANQAKNGAAFLLLLAKILEKGCSGPKLPAPLPPAKFDRVLLEEVDFLNGRRSGGNSGMDLPCRLDGRKLIGRSLPKDQRRAQPGKYHDYDKCDLIILPPSFCLSQDRLLRIRQISSGFGLGWRS